MLVPTLVSGLKGHHVVGVACGSGDAQTLAVTKDGKFHPIVEEIYSSKIPKYYNVKKPYNKPLFQNS